ncbi:MAG: efflux RND transporter periplasmic adaptor subunit [Rhodobacteraceae bacterium]|nr:efflux RND transporter periplasmic adaptor subunit [Paracoccaceae bacterium]
MLGGAKRNRKGRALALRSLILAGLVVSTVASPLVAGEIVIQPMETMEIKALFGRVESRFVVPARSRIGGTLTVLDITEGSEAKAGQVIARIVDPKLESQLAAAEARISSAKSQLENAETELTRNEELLAKGATTIQRVDTVRTTVEVARNGVAEAEAARQVTATLIEDGNVLAPADGRVLSVPVRLGAVVMPGEVVATITGGGVFLRLAIPERHASGLTVGAEVAVDGGKGTIEKVYPQIEQGRVIADVAVEGLSDSFIGQRILVQVPVATRLVLAVPDAAIEQRAGLDLVRIKAGEGEVEVTVIPGAEIAGPDGPLREILTGLRAGDTVMTP